MAYSSDIYSPNIAYDSGWRFRGWMQYEVQTNNDTTWMVSVKYGVALSSGYVSSTHDYDAHYVAVSSYIGSTKKTDTGWVVDNTDLSGSGTTWHQTGTTTITIAKTSSSQTLNLRIWGATSSSGANQAMNSVNLTIPAAVTYPTMTVSYHMNGGQIPDSPHQHSSTQIFNNQENMVYMATSTTGTFSKCTYSFTTATTYPNHWNVGTMGIVKPGYHYIGTEAWNTKADGTGVKINEDYSSSSTTNPATTKATNGGTEITSDVAVTLYVGWIPNTYTIVYDGNDATSGTTASSSHTFDVPKTLTPNGFSKEGYVFKGWSTSQTRANAGVVIFKDKQSVSSLTVTNNGTVTLYAVWAAPPLFGRIENGWFGGNKMWVNQNGFWYPVGKAYVRINNSWVEGFGKTINNCTHANAQTVKLSYCIGTGDWDCCADVGEYQNFTICPNCGMVHVSATGITGESMSCEDCDTLSDWDNYRDRWLPASTFNGLTERTEYTNIYSR